ncbi:MAG: hypothetical protein ACKVOQ_16740 [Cyclobacteriaceae bacterium]
MDVKLSSFFSSVLKSGLIVGAFDAVAASLQAYIMRGITPDKVFTFVASGAFGQSAYEGGSIMALIGLVFHFIIAIGWTFIFYVAFPKLTILQSNKFFVGMAYGIFIWLIMNFVVIPLSLIGLRPFNLVSASIQIIIHLFVIGVPISYLTHKFYFTR